MKLADLNSFLASYPGGVSIEEGLALSQYAEQCLNNVIVEIGSFKGKSAVAWLLVRHSAASRKPVSSTVLSRICRSPDFTAGFSAHRIGAIFTRSCWKLVSSNESA